eukprot:TRINITY_DN1421_c0_g1_i1.p1 TRINITY_DN1421_c0_g1~~TRINITY_DN1421_c0_g1_i1.p1  ORF type:complete len:330 (+),score=114.09 TRINITY_DN1421_c0_g1_i1:178-1167(+)
MSSNDSRNAPSWEANNKNGHYVRSERSFRDRLSEENGAPFPPASGRYHLYVSYACPWAHRTLIVRALKGLEDAITYDVVDYLLEKPKGWTLTAKDESATKDSINGFETLKEVYYQSQPDYSDSVTVPILYDKQTKKIVNNESSEIIRQFNTTLNAYAKNKDLDLYPSHLRAQIDEVNTWIYSDINNGVYKCGFATTQEAYEENVVKLFAALDRLEKILSENRFVCGVEFTEADVRLWTTLLRFDPVYVGHFKCNKKRIVDYPNIWNYTKELYQVEAIKKTVNMDHIKKHYYQSHITINPTKVVPLGPNINFEEPHDRNRLPAKSLPWAK